MLQIMLPASRGKGLEIEGTFTRRDGRIIMEMTFNNRAMSAMTDFAIQFNKNRFVFLFIYVLKNNFVLFA